MLEIHELELMCKIRSANSLEAICNLGYELFGNPMFVEDMAHTVLACTTCVELPEPEWIQNEPNLTPTPEQIESRRSVLLRLAQSAAPVILDDGQMQYPRMLKMLYRSGQPIGVVVIPALLRPFRKEDSYILSLLTDKIGECLASRSFVLTGDHAQVANLFIQLLNGDKLSKRQAAQRFAASYWTKRQYFWVIVISDVDGGILFAPDELRDPCTFRGNVTFPFQNYYVCIWKSDQDIKDWTQIPELQKLVDSQKYYIGISRSFLQPQLVQLHYCEAVEALRLALELNMVPKQRLVLYSDVAFYHMLEMTAPNCNLLSFCDRRVMDLAQYDERHGTELTHTLQVYLDHCKDMNAAAAVLGIHKNTVRYRIAKCLELMDSDLEDGAEIFQVLFSMRVLNYCLTLKRIPEDPERDAL